MPGEALLDSLAAWILEGRLLWGALVVLGACHPDAPVNDTGFEAGIDASTPVDGGLDAAQQIVAVPLEGCLGLHTVEVTVGGTQKLWAFIDTGSTSVAFAGPACSDCVNAGVTPLYQPGPLATDQRGQASSLFGTGTHGWSGEIFGDTLSLPNLPEVRTNIVSIEKQKDFFFPTWCLPHGYQGIFGLGPAAAAVPGTESYLDRLGATGAVRDVFAVKMCDTGGTLWFGGYDDSQTTAPPQYAPLLPTTPALPLYTVALSDIAVGGVSLGLAASAYGPAVLDTGSDAIYLPQAAFTQLADTVGNAPAFKLLVPEGAAWFSSSSVSNCRHLGKTKAELDAVLPKLSVTFGTSPAVVVEAPATESYLLAVEGLGGGTCWIRGVSTLPGRTSSIVGVSLMRSRITIFDRQARRVGFAPHVGCP